MLILLIPYESREAIRFGYNGHRGLKAAVFFHHDKQNAKLQVHKPPRYSLKDLVDLLGVRR